MIMLDQKGSLKTDAHADDDDVHEKSSSLFSLTHMFPE
jgi:hypothetical protein